MTEGDHPALAEALRGIQGSIQAQTRLFEVFCAKYDSELQGMSARFDREIVDVWKAHTTYAEKAGMRIDRLENTAREFHVLCDMPKRLEAVEDFVERFDGALAVIKWAGVAGALGLLALLVNAYGPLVVTLLTR